MPKVIDAESQSPHPKIAKNAILGWGTPAWGTPPQSFHPINCHTRCTGPGFARLPVESPQAQAHSRAMRHPIAILLMVGLVWLPISAQDSADTTANATTIGHESLQQAVALEAQGHFDAAIAVAKQVTDSNQLTGAALGRAYVVLGAAYKYDGKFIEAQEAFEQSLRLLEHDREHQDNYAAALSNYAGLYSDFGQIEIAKPMWQKALRLREQIGDHTGAMLSLVDLAGAALAQKRVREARDYLKRASDEMKLASSVTGDLTDDDRRVLFETQGWLALSEGKTQAGVAAYQRALELCTRARGEGHWLTGWDTMLLGKAYLQAGNYSQALTDMRDGLDIIGAAIGRKNQNYFFAELAYSQALDRSGAHLEAARLRQTAEQARKDFYNSQCAGCTISTAGFR
ncbi:MAG TPA: tetratricopeptide repeat protein [Terriglobales bacterium]|nr:tetratricopeptide repeat protein [Terriglobales bacterium]